MQLCWRWRRLHVHAMCDCPKCRRRRNCCSAIFRQLKFAFAPGQAGGQAEAGTLSLERASVSHHHRGELGELIALLLLQSPPSSSSSARLFNSFLASRCRGCANSRVRRSLNILQHRAKKCAPARAPSLALLTCSLFISRRRWRWRKGEMETRLSPVD